MESPVRFLGVSLTLSNHRRRWKPSPEFARRLKRRQSMHGGAILQHVEQTSPCGCSLFFFVLFPRGDASQVPYCHPTSKTLRQRNLFPQQKDPCESRQWRPCLLMGPSLALPRRSPCLHFFCILVLSCAFWPGDSRRGWDAGSFQCKEEGGTLQWLRDPLCLLFCGR